MYTFYGYTYIEGREMSPVEHCRAGSRAAFAYNENGQVRQIIKKENTDETHLIGGG